MKWHAFAAILSAVMCVVAGVHIVFYAWMATVAQSDHVAHWRNWYIGSLIATAACFLLFMFSIFAILRRQSAESKSP
jgi:hypothetical protein